MPFRFPNYVYAYIGVPRYFVTCAKCVVIVRKICRFFELSKPLRLQKTVERVIIELILGESWDFSTLIEYELQGEKLMTNFLAAAFGSPNYGKDIVSSLEAAGIGILLTFVVLALMIGILYAFKAIFAALNKREAAKKSAQTPDEAQVTAAILGAISEYRGDDDVKVQIKSIKKL